MVDVDVGKAGDSGVDVDSSIGVSASCCDAVIVFFVSSCCVGRSCSLKAEACTDLVAMLDDTFCDPRMTEARVGTRLVTSGCPAREVNASRRRR